MSHVVIRWRHIVSFFHWLTRWKKVLMELKRKFVLQDISEWTSVNYLQGIRDWHPVQCVYTCAYVETNHPISEAFFVHTLFLNHMSRSQLTNHLYYSRSSWHGGSCDVHAGLPGHCQPRSTWLEALQLGLRLVLLVWLHSHTAELTDHTQTFFFSAISCEKLQYKQS